MAINDYYGDKAGTTILQIFTEPLDGTSPVIHRRLTDEDAYDTWHLSYYLKEILEYRRLMDRPTVDLQDIPRPEKNLLLYLLVAANPGLRSIVELGSSLFEMIDGFEVIRKYIGDQNSPLPLLDLEDIEYQGIELSEMLRLTSRVLHSRYRLRLYENASAYDGRAGIAYDRSVTNYAYETVDELIGFVGKSEVALLNTYFSLGETFRSSRLGKTLTYFSLDEFLAKSGRPFFHLFGLKAPGPYSGEDISQGRPVIEGFFLSGEAAAAEGLMTMAARDPKVAAYFALKDIRPKEPRSIAPLGA